MRAVEDLSSDRICPYSCGTTVLTLVALLSVLLDIAHCRTVQIDMDTIETSNLNRQFLFRKHHVGESKAKVAAEAVKRFRPNARIQADQVQHQRWPAHMPTLQHTELIWTASFARHMLDTNANLCTCMTHYLYL